MWWSCSGSVTPDASLGVVVLHGLGYHAPLVLDKVCIDYRSWGGSAGGSMRRVWLASSLEHNVSP